MAAHENLGLQFKHVPGPYHTLRAYQGKREVGKMTWDAARIGSLYTKPAFRRQGVATALYGEAQRLHGEAMAPAPRHSPTLTEEGAAWAGSVGGESDVARPKPKPKNGRIELDTM
jgi:GNAT superfamily N-acetyltransferase